MLIVVLNARPNNLTLFWNDSINIKVKFFFNLSFVISFPGFTRYTYHISILLVCFKKLIYDQSNICISILIISNYRGQSVCHMKKVHPQISLRGHCEYLFN